MKQAGSQLRGSPDEAPPPADFRALYAAQFRFVWRCLGALGVPPAGLDDATQEVFMVVHRRLPEFRGDASVRTWLYEIVRKVAANAKRAVRRKGQHAELLDNEPSVQPGPFEHFESRENAGFVYAFVNALDEKKRDVFVLAIIEQMTIPEVSTILGVPLNTAYTRLRAVKREFQIALQAQRGRS